MKRPLAEARTDAEAFRDLFVPHFERWEIAGSVRRRRPEVSDVEHVVVPRFGYVPAGLFGETEKVNLLWHHLDALVRGGQVAKHVYGTRDAAPEEWTEKYGTVYTGPSYMKEIHRWGEKYRGVDFNGFNHEIFCAEPDNFGCILAIRTGPAEFSKDLVTRILSSGMYRQQGGGVVVVASGERVPIPDERRFFKFAQVAYREPWDRK